MIVLGVSAGYHDSAAALVQDGHIICAAEEERFTRVKHDRSFPVNAIAYCLSEAGVERPNVVVFYEDRLSKFLRIQSQFASYAPQGADNYSEAMLSQKKILKQVRESFLTGDKASFCSHHMSHAASAFYPSPFLVADILTVDGVGEKSTAMISRGKANRIYPFRELHYPHSLGLLYSAFTAHLGFEVNEGEYKLMGLAAYGEPSFAADILNRVVDLKEDGSIWIHQEYFQYSISKKMTTPKFEGIFGPPRRPGEPVTKAHADIAASIQKVTEEVILRMARFAKRINKSSHSNLCLAGGVALNCMAMGRLLREGPYENIWIQPAAGDSGGALGCALHHWYQTLNNYRLPLKTDSMRGSFLGPRERVCELVSQSDFRRFAIDEVAELLTMGKIVGVFKGRMEFGPRALGGRSILADPRDPEMKARVNGRIKHREEFRPFAPTVLASEVHKWFDVPESFESPYMLFTVKVKRPDAIPAVTHVDGTARIQTVDERRNSSLFLLLTRFFEWTGVPVLLNTSFNDNGEPIVKTPQEALHCYHRTNLDALVLEDYLLVRPCESSSTSSTTSSSLRSPSS